MPNGWKATLFLSELKIIYLRTNRTKYSYITLVILFVKYSYLIGLVVFYGMSEQVGYLMLNSVYPFDLLANNLLETF